MTTGLTVGEFQNALTPSLLRQMQILQVAITAAPLLYLVVVFILEFTLTPATTGDAMVETLAILSVAHCILAIIAYGASFALFNGLFTEQRLRRSMPLGQISTELLVNLSLMLLRTGIILRLAFFEGIAFVGLSICVIGVSTGAIDAHPEFWLNGTTTGVLLVFSVMTFPTKERMVQLFNEKLASGIASWATSVSSTS